MTKFTQESLHLFRNSPLEYYKILPSPEHLLIGKWPTEDEFSRAINSATQALQTSYTAALDDLCTVQEYIFLKGSQGKSIQGKADWKGFLSLLSQAYISLLRVAEQRELRMSLQRLNYFIQLGLSEIENAPDIPIHHQTLSIDFCWDYLNASDYTCYISRESGSNFHVRRADGASENYTAGLPTQLDIAPSGIVYIGSCYSSGLWHWDGKDLVHHPLANPIVITFEFDGAMWHLDTFGNLCKDSVLVLNIPVEKVWVARQIDEWLLIPDWSVCGKLYQLNLLSFIGRIKDAEPIFIMNDICFHDQFYYVIDKQQGSIFKFDRDFNFLDKQLSFGIGAGKLFDPISLRLENNMLCVISWITSEYTQIEAF